jgi:hypothetical protein
MATLQGWPCWRGRTYQEAPQAFMLSLGLKSHAGKIFGGGTSGDEVLSSVASEKMASFYTKNSATSGTSVALYWKHEVSGIAGSGVAGRFFTYSNVACATLMGTQISAETGAAGKVTGLLTGCRSQVLLANDATVAPAGTIAGGQSELYFNGDNSSTTDITGSKHSIHRFVLDGDTTARAKCLSAFEFINIPAGTGTHMLKTDMHTAAPTDGLKIRIDDVFYYISLVAA